MITSDAVAAAVRTLWAASGINNTIASSKVYLGRNAERTDYPLANLMIGMKSSEITSGWLTLQTFTVGVEAYCVETTDSGTLQKNIMELAGRPDSQTGGLAITGAKVIFFVLDPNKGTTLAMLRRDGKDICKIETRFTLLLQTLRN